MKTVSSNGFQLSQSSSKRWRRPGLAGSPACRIRPAFAEAYYDRRNGGSTTWNTGRSARRRHQRLPTEPPAIIGTATRWCYRCPATIFEGEAGLPSHRPLASQVRLPTRMITSLATPTHRRSARGLPPAGNVLLPYEVARHLCADRALQRPQDDRDARNFRSGCGTTARYAALQHATWGKYPALSDG